MQTEPASPLPVPGAASAMSSLPRGGGDRRFAFIKGALQPSLPLAFDPGPSHAGAGGTRNRAMSERISWNIFRGAATSAIWNVT